MAILDTDADEIVIRVVYDGPPEAGKTTSMRALATSLSQETVTPEEDATGRTLWFDWMEYVGGRFEGSRIRCQIVSVPGQRELGARRQRLLQSADVVVFVGDSTPPRWDISLDYLFELQTLVATDGPPIGVVFQANKRDAPDAIPLSGLRTRLGDARWSVGVVESVAADGTGIREAFVYAVRLALDRVRELVSSGQLPQGPAEVTSPAALLAQLRAADAAAEAAEARRLAPRGPTPLPIPPPPPLLPPVVGVEPEPAATRVVAAPNSVAAELLRDVLEAEAAAEVIAPAPTPARAARARTGPAPPWPPDASAPSGAIWPPVEGRAILYEVSQLELVLRPLGNGDWSAGLGSGWRIVSSRDAVYDSLDAGRSALIVWARLHAACLPAVSARRCIVLAASGDGRWRLWQIVRAESTLRDFVGATTEEPTPDLAIFRLCQTATLLVDLHERVSGMPCELTCSLDTVGQSDTNAVYVGLMPSPGAPTIGTRLAASALLAAELGPMLALDLASQRDDLHRALARIPRRFQHAETVVSSLEHLLA